MLELVGATAVPQYRSAVCQVRPLAGGSVRNAPLRAARPAGRAGFVSDDGQPPVAGSEALDATQHHATHRQIVGKWLAALVTARAAAHKRNRTPRTAKAGKSPPHQEARQISRHLLYPRAAWLGHGRSTSVQRTFNGCCHLPANRRA